ncbi:2'-5' RNA ligase family protein [Micromonospora chalcea]|uniref:phage major capsid protein n=1 Tax=Micromonospora chalcea TaxID=1874 RepID=UPI0021A2AAB8|nr:2'-5' RNA ligase family protein [Micromonospora chalcea]MCT2276321.1 2'-5' RNA ligase family protein [Micromonospora chalcea]
MTDERTPPQVMQMHHLRADEEPAHSLGPERCPVCVPDAAAGRVREVGPEPDPRPRRVTEATTAVPAETCMVCLDIPDDVAAALAVPGGLPPQDLHVTLAYLGKTLDDAQRGQVADIVAEVAAAHPPLSGQVGGLGQFPPGDDGVPVWATVDVPGLAELRQDLVARLAAAGLPVDGQHGYTPHMTLTYLADGEAPPAPVPPTPVAFAAVTWTRGPQWTPVPLAGAAGDSKTETSVTTESTHRDRVPGRVIEAKGTDTAGGRVYRVRIIRAGESRNRRRYPHQVLAAAARLYEGAKAYDHHRTEDELRTSTIAGLVGSYRNVVAEADGLYADLHLLPGATHAAQALDAALQAAEAGLEPLVGISHDVLATWKPVTEGGQRVEEASSIVRVFSADIVADPAAGGRATRMVAGGIDSTTTDTDPAGATPDGQSKESDVTAPLDTAAVLAALTNASDEQLAAVGLSKAAPAGDTTGAAATGGKPSTGGEATAEGSTGGTAATGTAGATGATESVQRSVEAGQPKTGFLGQLMIRHKVEAAGLPIAVVESVTAALPDQITESVVDGQIAAIKGGLAIVERAGLVGAATVGGSVTVTKESAEKRAAALDAMFDGDYGKGYRSFREAWADITGYRPQAWGEDLNRRILRECFGAGFDSAVRGTESMTTASWAQVLGDSITRRMIKLYSQPSLQTWRKIVSEVVPVNDFRDQKRTRIGGYGTLPVVNEGAPYQPLQSPGDEEAVYKIIKRGGTDDLTLEMIANDDMGAIRNIPRLLGLAAAITLYRFVWDLLISNAVCTYDSTALFHAAHNNTDNPAVLNSTSLATGRRRMRRQAAYGDSTNILSLTPKLLIVPSELEEIAFQLTTSAVAVTAASDATVPNLHRGMDFEVLDHWTDPNDWFLAADPSMCPTIEVGFYQGREKPELFTQADANTGTMFNADKYTYKIRHVYSATPLEHRGFYRGAN